MITQIYPANATASFSDNAANQLTQIVDRNAGRTWTFGYGRDAVGRLASATDPLEPLQHSYGYDTLNRLTGDQRSTGTTNWSYDTANELTQIADATTTRMAIARDRRTA